MKSNGGDVTETYCSDNEEKNAGVAVGTWVNTNAQVIDFNFQLEVPLTADNALHIANLNPDNFESYMAGFDELKKFEVHFKCVKEPEPTSESTTPTPGPTTSGPTTLNSNYVNGLDQENLIIFDDNLF